MTLLKIIKKDKDRRLAREFPIEEVWKIDNLTHIGHFIMFHDSTSYILDDDQHIEFEIR